MRGCVRVLRFIVFPPYPHLRPSNAITSLGSLSRHTHMGALSIIKARLTQTSASRGTVSTEALSNPSVDLQESLAKSVTSLSPDSAALAINTMDKLPDTRLSHANNKNTRTTIAWRFHRKATHYGAPHWYEPPP